MVAFFSLIAAALFGAGDFLGGQASKRTTIVTAIACSNFVGLILVLILAPFLAERFYIRDFTAGMLGGMSGLIGISFLYRGLSTGPMALVAPTAAVTNAAVPVLWGISFGERLTQMHLAGIGLGLLAIVLVSRPPESAGPVSGRLIFESVLSGIGFAGFFIVLDGTQGASAPWPIVGSRLMTVTFLLAVLFLVRRSRGTVRPAWLLLFTCGLCDSTANVMMLEALNRGMLSLVAVLASLYPAATVLLARTVLREPISRNQLVGLFGALGAIGLIING